MILENVTVTDAGAEGMSIGKTGDQVIFIPYAVPGDLVNVNIIRKKKRYLEGRITEILKPSPIRVTPHCRHFGICGGCRWQNMDYNHQLLYKQKQVTDHLQRIGKINDYQALPILPSSETTFYRNKLDFTFSIYRWREEWEKNDPEKAQNSSALGFHVPGFFDKVVDIQYCYHQPEPSNQIRNFVRNYAITHQLGFYDVRHWSGLLRNLIIRNTLAGDLMVILVFRQENPENQKLLDRLRTEFPQITSLYSVISDKKNDTIFDLPLKLVSGLPYITEIIPPYLAGFNPVQYRIGPVSFFQTNSSQAARLYRIAADFAGFQGNETVYDLYTGAGAIACYIAPYVKKVIGIESVAEAIRDAVINADLNHLTNTAFFAGEAEKLLNQEFINSKGRPEIVITDPPRNGMHEKVVRTLLEVGPGKIVYVSCNSATQARDLSLMADQYQVIKCQAVDMFPHTQHIENVALLIRRS